MKEKLLAYIQYESDQEFDLDFEALGEDTETLVNIINGFVSLEGYKWFIDVDSSDFDYWFVAKTNLKDIGTLQFQTKSDIFIGIYDLDDIVKSIKETQEAYQITLTKLKS